jgi:hypothetical protein
MRSFALTPSGIYIGFRSHKSRIDAIGTAEFQTQTSVANAIA